MDVTSLMSMVTTPASMTGQLHTQPVPFVLGPFMFDRKVSNVFVRHGSPGSGLIVNAQQGAAVNSVLLAPS